MRADTADYREIFLSGAPLIDLRAPCEFLQGSFRGAVNLPLMSDEERSQVGTCYKQNGQQAAIELGHQLVSGEVRQTRIEAWRKFAEQNSRNGYMFCFRGGLRSQTVQAWLAQAQVDLPLIKGGYKAMRRFLIDETVRFSQQMSFYLLSGLTGSAKTTLIETLTNSVNLEALANHRGSSFGKQLTPQPTQIDFENELAIQLLKLEQGALSPVILEDESRLIGSRSIPIELHQAMGKAPIVILQESLDKRVDNILNEYVIDMYHGFCELPEVDPVEAFKGYLLGAIDKIRKRLGGELYGQLQTTILKAIDYQQSRQRFDIHCDWIRPLLDNYYDPMYRYQLSKKRERIVFQGKGDQVKEFIESL
ncbi:tRNA 2-selenouridine(34) synthase MnmH [Aliikangiella coralliicola]|uniref:tRNA 2-selenouridine synthase n=1 Tax=Aliikangiella coralliicola TaxID=2592383 RepID=A0A545UH32_9GAMM|nr:tRNA 2-selenouridine(34) synthase MnmH [Aliikangiella coralliicola]TQV88769.1 tRNA 2-selenouridine(34) synthase MnmH [Aliikangiella coralliicola]